MKKLPRKAPAAQKKSPNVLKMDKEAFRRLHDRTVRAINGPHVQSSEPVDHYAIYAPVETPDP